MAWYLGWHLEWDMGQRMGRHLGDAAALILNDKMPRDKSLCTVAHIFEAAMANYESDVTQFIRGLLNEEPELKSLQKKNRATWWDRSQDADQNARNAQSEAPKAPYAYFPLPKRVK